MLSPVKSGVISDVRRIIGNVVSLRLCTIIRALISMLMSMRVIRYKNGNQSNHNFLGQTTAVQRNS